jgi:hypothetical protein
MIDPSTIATIHSSADKAGFGGWQQAGRATALRMDPNGRTAGPIPYFGSMIHRTALATQDMSYAPQSASGDAGRPDIAYEKQEEDYSFGDVIDIINPLQHLPVVGMIYRELTGDTMKSFSSIIGGAIFGGPIGAVSSTVNAIVKEETGRDIAENALSAIGFDIAPAPAKKPDIVYETAAQSYEKNKRNFAAKSQPDTNWNA